MVDEFRVPWVDLKQRYQEERDEILASIDRILTDAHLVMTEELQECEEKISAYTGAKHCIGLNSGTDALMMALMTLGIGKGDEVITTPVSFVATTGSIAHVGATPVYVDVADDQNLDPTKIEEKITPKTKAIMPVHWSGRIADMDAINAIAEKHGLMVIEDSAQCMGAYYKGRHGGTLGHAGAISCHPLKNLNALGDGGFLLTNSDVVNEKVRLYRNHGLQGRDNCVEFGVNSRLDVLHAEVLKYRLTKLDAIITSRRMNANLYRQLIKAPEVYIPPCKDYEENAFVIFIAQCENRDALIEHLTSKGIQAMVYYGTPLHLHPAAARYGFTRGDFPVAEKQCDSVVAFPHHQHLSEDQISFVADEINGFYGTIS